MVKANHFRPTISNHIKDRPVFPFASVSLFSYNNTIYASCCLREFFPAAACVLLYKMLFIYLFLRQNLFFLFRISRARLPMITQIFRGAEWCKKPLAKSK